MDKLPSVFEDGQWQYPLQWLLEPLAEWAEEHDLPVAQPRTAQLSAPAGAEDEVNVKQLSEVILTRCAAATDPAAFDPAYFIRRRIEEAVIHRVADEKNRERIKADSEIWIKYIEAKQPNRSDSLKAVKDPADWKLKKFSLGEICTDYHYRALKDVGFSVIQWPVFYPAELVKDFTAANYQEDFRKYVCEQLQHPAAHAFGSLLKKAELNKLAVEYIRSDSRSLEDKKIVFEYLKGLIPARLLNLHSDPDLVVDNAVFLGRSNLDNGVLFFLGEHSAAFEFPAGHDARGRFVENNPDLQKHLLNSVPLSAQQKKHVRDFIYRGQEFPLFATRPNYREIVFRTSTDTGTDLFDRQIARALSDIDTLVSTQSERATDIALEAAGYLLQCISFAVSIPSGGTSFWATAPIRLMVPFLVGLGASATDLVRAELTDDPSEAERLRIDAAIGVLSELAGPIAEKLLGKALSIAARKKISRRVLTALKQSNRPSLVRRPIGSISHQLASTVGKEIPEAGKGLLVAGYLSELAGGPSVAQTLSDRARAVRLSGPEKGYVYQGFVFRGDTRDPKIIFEQGFKQRTPIKNLNQVNGLKGGYGGAHDAFDLDGAGISTSAFYRKDGAGAFVYGGQKGGHTYFIDARRLEGFHLYANTELAFRPHSGLKQLPPLEINYGVDLPPGLILGAYDKNGKFIANPKAINRAIARSEINPLDGGGRNVINKLDNADLAGVDFSNEGVAEQEIKSSVTTVAPTPAKPAGTKVDINDILAFRERQEAQRKPAG